jgi:prevent-host-death family protein
VTQVSVREARDNLSRLIKNAQAGEEIVIASHGKAVARLVPVVDSTGAGIAAWIRANQLPPDRARSRQEVDDYLATERESWE